MPAILDTATIVALSKIVLGRFVGWFKRKKKKEKKMNDTLLIAIRQILLVAGGSLVTKGYVDQAGLEVLVGAVAVVLAAVWRYVDAHKKVKALAQAKKA
jgi:hypothetical protein